LAENDRRTFTREIVVYTTAGRLAAVRCVKEFERKIKRNTPDAFNTIANDSFFILDEALDEQRNELIHMRGLRGNANSMFALFFLALNVFGSGVFWKTDKEFLLLLTSYLVALGFASNVPRVVINDIELGAAAAEPLLQRSYRPAMWAAACTAATVVCDQSRTTLVGAMYQAFGASVLCMRMPCNKWVPLATTVINGMALLL
jgi:hypothetical protein